MSPKSPDNTERINVFFSKAVLEQLKIEAKERGMTVSGFVRMIVMQEYWNFSGNLKSGLASIQRQN